MGAQTPTVVTTFDTDLTDFAKRESVNANRNVMFGLWAADTLGLKGAAREDYAISVHIADYAAPGIDDLIAKVKRDFEIAGIDMPEIRLRNHLHEMQERVRLEIDTAGPDTAPR